MANERIPLLAFNRGLISPLGLVRVDLRRSAMSAETQNNFMPRVLGSMMLRPGLGYIGTTYNNSAARYLPFVFSTTDTALLEFTDSLLRVWASDALITRASVSTAVTNGNFTSNITNWTDASDAGATAAWATGGYLSLTGTGTTYAKVYQQVTVAAADQGTAHALRVVIQRGPVTIRVGSTNGGDDYVAEAALDTGTHSLGFTPTGNFYIEFKSLLLRAMLVDSCNVESSGTMTLPTPFTASDLSNIRSDQSGDEVFIACSGHQQRIIQRRDNNSWSIVLYKPDDGPFLTENTTPITIAPTATTGNTTLTASAALFRSTHVGALFSIASVGQYVQSSLSAQNTFTNSIKVTGTGTARSFTRTATSLTGTGSTVTLQRSVDEQITWTDIAAWTADNSASYTDGLDNVIAYYRFGIKTGDYSTGTITLSMTYPSGSITGIARITAYSSATSVSCEVITPFGGTTASAIWNEGTWSDYRGWPTSVAFFDGRLWWAGKSGVWGSISDAYTSFDASVTGDSGTIARTIGSGPVDTINFILPLQRMILGAQGAEWSVRASSLDEVLTPTNFSMKTCSTQGSAAVDVVKLDKIGIYVSRNKSRVFELIFDAQAYDYSSVDLTAVTPDLNAVGIVRIGIQRKPDTRIHLVRSDGTVAVLVYDHAEDVKAWITIDSTSASGLIEDVVVLPAVAGNIDDDVYYVVKRTVNGSTVRYLEKMAQESSCQGGTLNKQADAYITYSGTATTSITGLSHLEGQSVVVWADGADVGTTESGSTWTQTYTVSGGAITLATAASNVVVGLPYTAQFKSTKLGMHLNRQKNINHLGLVLYNYHYHGLRYGPDFSNLDDMPGTEAGTTVSGVNTNYDYQPNVFPGKWDTDARLCLQAQAPRPVSVLAATIDMEPSR